jgi:hypothetical protein
LTANDAEMRNEIEKELDLKFNIEHWIEKRKLLKKRDPVDQKAFDATTVELEKELDNLTQQPVRRGEEGLSELNADEFEIKQELGMELNLEQLIALREWLKTQPNEDRRLRKVSSALLGMLDKLEASNDDINVIVYDLKDELGIPQNEFSDQEVEEFLNAMAKRVQDPNAAGYDKRVFESFKLRKLKKRLPE